MYNSLLKFLNKIIDYAGMYPPANLDIETAFQNYLVELYDNNKWILGKFVISARKLISLSVINENEEFLNPIELSVLLTNEYLFNDYYTSLNNDIKNIKLFDFEKFIIKSFELKIPLELNIIDKFDKVSDFIKTSYESISDSLITPSEMFFEININEEWKYLIPIFIETLADFRSKNYKVGFKLRTGGVSADMYPFVDQVVHAIYSCNENKIPFKATAGLHHPLRYFDAKINGYSNGFLNVFGAGIITNVYNLKKNILAEIVSEENPKNFVFDNNKFSWKNYIVNLSEIEFARNNFMVSFGSCSFDEPIEDLKKMNFL